MRSNTVFHDGDAVVIREWDDMEAEYGTNEYGNIDCRYIFTEDMREFCGTPLIIESIEGSYVIFKDLPDDAMAAYSWSADMICHAEEFYDLSASGSDEVPEDDFMAIINSWM